LHSFFLQHPNMSAILIKNAKIVNQGTITEGDVLIKDEFISKVDNRISVNSSDWKIIDAEGNYLLPGMIDDQVHFREPGLTYKADIASESKAAVAGGITSFIEQPNTVPNTTTQRILEQKYEIASKKSYANYSFMIGATNRNLKEILKTNPKNVAGIKMFLGASTGNMLVDNPKAIENIFSQTNMLIAVHCEDETIVKTNLEKYKKEFAEDIPAECHPKIRSAEACYSSSTKIIELAKKTGTRLHIFHLSTAKETELLTNKISLDKKQITAEVCIHHLWFTDKDYVKKGNLIKWNPAIKSESDKNELWKALLDGRIDNIATDHAPHTLEEKSKKYLEAPAGAPMVQHALVALFENHLQGKISIEQIAEKTAHNPAKIFKIHKRGFIQEGYYADLTIVDTHQPWNVNKSNILYKCAWSPFEGTNFKSKITHTFINGKLVFQNGKIKEERVGQRLIFDRE